MPRYQREGSWFNVDVDGDALIIRDAGGERTESFDTEDEAEAAYDACVFDALQQGYRLTEEPVDPKTALEATILRNPDDVEAHLVYADLLMSNGDPRGELIALHAEMLAKPTDAEARTRAARFRKEHVDELYGDFQELMDHGLELEWKLGFVRAAKLKMHPHDWAEDAGGWSTDDLVDMLATFLAHPSARFLRDLSIQIAWHRIEDEGVMDPIIAAIAQTEGPWDALTSLEIMPDLDSYAGNEINNGDLLFTNLPALRALKIRCDLLHLREPIQDPPIARLTLVDCLSHNLLRGIGAATWPNLLELDLLFGRSTARPEHVRLMLQPDRFPRLTTLRLRRARFTDELVDMLLDVPQLLARLEVLDLSGGSMTDSAARSLVKSASLFPRLARLDVSDNQLDTETNIDLRKLPCKVIFGEQNAGQFDDRFDEIQE